MEVLNRVIEEPLRAIPAEFHSVVYKFWMRWGHLIKDHLLTLCCRVGDYYASGLTASELSAIFANINASELNTPVRFPADLFGMLTAQAGSCIKIKKTQAKNMADRAEVEAMTKEAAEARAMVGSLLNSFAQD
jgi:hypothetical protein